MSVIIYIAMCIAVFIGTVRSAIKNIQPPADPAVGLLPTEAEWAKFEFEINNDRSRYV